MMIKHAFVNQVIGVASGFRDVSLNYVSDSETFNLKDRDPAEFPIATQRRFGSDSSRFSSRRYSTLWHDESHWTHIGDVNRTSSNDPLGTTLIAGCPDGQTAFPLDTQFKSVVENMRDEKLAAIQNHFDRNIAMINGEIWRRECEPCYCLKLDVTKDGRKVTGKYRDFVIHGYYGQRFRLDDVDGFREAVLDYTDLGWTLGSSDGVQWSVPDIEVLIPESIALDPEAQTVLDVAYSLREPARAKMKGMSYSELDATCLLLDAFEYTRPESARFNEIQIADMMDAVRSLSKYDFEQYELNTAALELVTERWDNRAIGDFLPVRTHSPAF
jgi:hypothetical protein